MEGSGFGVGKVSGEKGGYQDQRQRSLQGTALALASAALEPPKPNNELVGRVLLAFFPSSFLLRC